MLRAIRAFFVGFVFIPHVVLRGIRVFFVAFVSIFHASTLSHNKMNNTDNYF